MTVCTTVSYAINTDSLKTQFFMAKEMVKNSEKVSTTSEDVLCRQLRLKGRFPAWKVWRRTWDRPCHSSDLTTYACWVKVKVHTLDIAPLRSESPLQKRSGMARVLKDFTVLPADPHVHPQSEWAIPAFAFPAITGTHLPTPEGWKAE